MFLLSGLLGMFALGTLAFVATGPGSDDDEDAALLSDDFEDDGDTQSHTLEVAMDEPTDSGEAISPEQSWTLAPAGTPLVLQQPAASAPPVSGGSEVTYEGTPQADEHFGTEDDELMFGRDGGDTLLGEDGDDTLYGQQGGDDLYGGTGSDVLFGGHGQDTLTGDDGDDLLRGGQGTDALHGRDGDDTLNGDMGNDTLFGAAGDDVLIGVDFDDDGSDRDGQDHLNAGSGDDTVVAGDEDVVALGSGADVLYLGDWMTGPGAEVLDFDDTEDQLLVVYNDSVQEGEPEVAMRLNPDNPTLTEITLGDTVLATLPTEDAPALEAIVLIAESALDDLELDVLPARAG